ncbi:MAG: hypothetical protein EZS28_031133 [Streblomastix strix]|uniref:Uncharacterized protein n=1 Tax=Streblomastix strix TaxID=222440 RepID=A0A5J4UTP0_9EUKA|nr:MAG: hypothetical protein EZS28_031133 [Streblomastix strix]
MAEWLMAGIRGVQLVTQDTQDTQDTWIIHIIHPQFKFMAYGRWQTKIAGVSRICSIPFLVPPRQITSFIHSASTHTLMVEQIRDPFPKGLPYFICMDNSHHFSTPLIN